MGFDTCTQKYQKQKKRDQPIGQSLILFLQLFENAFKCIQCFYITRNDCENCVFKQVSTTCQFLSENLSYFCRILPKDATSIGTENRAADILCRHNIENKTDTTTQNSAVFLFCDSTISMSCRKIRCRTSNDITKSACLVFKEPYIWCIECVILIHGAI